jgi:predicted RNA methylase
VFEGVDATTFKIEKPYDIVISETMQAALKKEPQVAIMQNLIPQMPVHAVFIPQQIAVDAALVSRGTWNSEACVIENVERMDLGSVMAVDRDHLNPDQFRSTLQIPPTIGACDILKLFTTIQVYGNHVLGENDCSLNIPIKLMDATGMESETLDFWYEQGEVPHICCRAVGTLKMYHAQGRPDRKPQEMYESQHV